MGFRIGVVCYAPQATQPTPLLSRTFFGSPPVILKDITVEGGPHGLGHTSTGGGKGMAVLEGLVAVLELFDVLKETTHTKPDSVPFRSYVIHLAAGLPDSAERPMWNVSSVLDGVTWDTLPSEFRKRDIHYSLIQVRPIPRLHELYNSIAGTASRNAFFDVFPGHSVKLMGYPEPETNPKRVAETDVSPESKRARIASKPHSSPTTDNATAQSSNTPKIAPAKVRTANTAKVPASPTVPQPPAIVSQPPPAPVPVLRPPSAPSAPSAPSVPSASSAPVASGSTTATQPPSASIAPAASTSTTASVPPEALPTSTPQATNVALQKFMERLKASEAKMATDAHLADVAEAEGRHEDAKALREQLHNTKLSLAKVRDALKKNWEKHKQTQEKGGPGPSSSTSSGPANVSPKKEPMSVQIPPPPTTTLPPAVPPSRPTAPASQPPAASPIRLPAQIAPHQQGTPAGPPMGPPAASPRVAAQMQKLIEQRNRTPHMPPSTIPGPPEQGPSVNRPMNNQVPHWKGLLTWSGSDSETHVRRDMQASVAMLPNRGAETLGLEHWPHSMAIAPSRERAVSPPVLQEWLKKHQCTLLNLAPIPQSAETKALNEDCFKTLFRLLTEKGIYAIAAWSTQGGPLENRLLIFPIQKGLYAAYFHTAGGMPELPKPITDIPRDPAQMAKWKEVFTKLSPDQQATLMSLPPDKRVAWIQSLAVRQQQHLLLQQQQQQQQHLQQQQQLQHFQQQQQVQAMPMQQDPALTAMQAMAAHHAFPPQQMSNPMMNGFPGGLPSQGMQLPHGVSTMNFNMPQMAPHGLHQRTPSGNGLPMGQNLPPGVSREMLQSFMNRNAG
ncbi:hypothetical protein BDW22DRAFT_742100 [Trametopsis cervina]|nr:hypothetical protein BDW22DRAFT_742100 [Trametopsis cervina]